MGARKVITAKHAMMTLDQLALGGFRIDFPLMIIVSPFVNADKVEGLGHRFANTSIAVKRRSCGDLFLS
jgi:hypothetical protein